MVELCTTQFTDHETLLKTPNHNKVHNKVYNWKMLVANQNSRFLNISKYSLFFGLATSIENNEYFSGKLSVTINDIKFNHERNKAN